MQSNPPDAQKQMNIGSGLLFANPVPQDYEILRQDMHSVISQALLDGKNASVDGSQNTPFILNRIRELTKGRSIIANRALVESNVVCATRISVELSRLLHRSTR